MYESFPSSRIPAPPTRLEKLFPQGAASSSEPAWMPKTARAWATNRRACWSVSRSRPIINDLVFQSTLGIE
jgi:hypothetical protein